MNSMLKERPRLVLVDYIGLVHGAGKSRYERVSSVAEDLKVIAKVTQTIIIIASQVGRDEDPEIRLSSGKDSGSLEMPQFCKPEIARDDAMPMAPAPIMPPAGTVGIVAGVE